MKINFSVKGVAISQGRPRFTTRGGFVRVYDPPKCREYKSRVCIAYQSILTPEIISRVLEYFSTGFFSLRITEYRSYPRSWSKKRKQATKYPVSKPDIDNIYKIVADALNGVIWRDDSQIVHGEILKVYDTEPRLDIEIEILGGGNND